MALKSKRKAYIVFNMAVKISKKLKFLLKLEVFGDRTEFTT